MQVTRFGHSALLVEAADTRILIDPGGFSVPETFELTDLDAIVVTHQHPDHIDRHRIGGLYERNPNAVVLSDPDTATQMPEFAAHNYGVVTEIGGLTLTGVGIEHAEILPTIPRVTNVGVLITAEGEPTLFHPGDSYAEAPTNVDILALPLTAPWTKIAETVDFVRRVAPSTVIPIHDAGATGAGHQLYWGHVSNHGGVDDARDLASTQSATFA